LTSPSGACKCRSHNVHFLSRTRMYKHRHNQS
jgi:hypothetical protein